MGHNRSLVDSTLSPSRSAKLMPWIVCAISLLIYMGTMTPGMQMGDGTELAAAAYVSGVPHPTGYPLYMMLSKLWLTLTMGGEVIARTTLLNCIFMAAAAGLTSVILRDFLQTVWQSPVSKSILWLAATGGLLTAFIRFHWENAVVTEVYALQFLLTLVFVRIVQKVDMGSGPDRSSLLALTAVFGLTLAHHRLSVTLILPWLGIWVWAILKKRRSGAASQIQLPYFAALLILIIGVSSYLYIPIRAAQQPPINWGNATTASAFYNHVRGTEYLDRGLMKPGLGQEFSQGQAAMFARLQTQQIIGDLGGQIIAPAERFVPGPPGSQKIFILSSNFAQLLGFALAGLSGAGWILAFRRGAKASSAIIAVIAVQNLLVLYVYNIADIRDYYLFPFWALTVGATVLCPNPDRNSAWARVPVLLVSAVVLLTAFKNYPLRNQNNNIMAELLSETILPGSKEIMPAGSILITDDDAETFTTWYRQKVREERTDVLHFAGNFVYMPWYKAFFTPEQQQQFQITLADGVALSGREYTMQLRTAIIDNNIGKHPIFTSINDPVVLMTLAEIYDVEPIDAVEVTHPLYNEVSTTVLFKISPKETFVQ